MGKTRGVQETSPEIRNRMVGMFEAGLGLKEIALAVNCSQRTVKRWLNRFNKEGSVDTRDRCGRKRATTKEQDEAIIRLAMQTPLTAAKSVLPALGLNCSVDTIRERLHKAGIHNWSPCKKQIQKIPIKASEGVKIQQVVWRPTGTKVLKSKSKNKINTKAITCKPKKKTVKKTKLVEKVIESDNGQNQVIEHSEERINFSFSNAEQTVQTQPQISEIPLPLSMPPPIIHVNPNHFENPLNFVPPNQPMYQHHPGLSISHHWPLDLEPHSYIQNAHSSDNHELQAISLIHSTNHHNISPNQHLQDHPHKIHNVNHQDEDHAQDLPDLDDDKLSESQDVIINVCSDVCSNSDASSNENSQISSIGDEFDINNSYFDKSKRTAESDKNNKTVGKIKGTLETSLEIRNRMIGMSEAGLSTLSIALTINRSERTVKRWLDRWKKEGNVKTKERKGRKRITTKEQDEAIIAMATQQPLTAAKYVVPALGLKCSVDTVRERLHKAGIHSWKLGKKQGEGNATQTIHLWQPSGNRTSKIKNKYKKKKLLTQKINEVDNKQLHTTQTVVEQSIAVQKPEVQLNLIHEEVNNVPYQNQPPTPPLCQPLHSIPTKPAALLHQPHIQPHSLYPQGPAAPSQIMQSMGPLMPTRPDCRLAFSAVIPQIHSQITSNIAYPSCMMGTNSSLTTHIEQCDTINYEPYIWGF